MATSTLKGYCDSQLLFIKRKISRFARNDTLAICHFEGFKLFNEQRGIACSLF
jgi:hypothetical protein